MLIILSLALLLLLPPSFSSPCGHTPIPPKLHPQTKIVGGTAAVKGSWPWQIQLKYNNNHFCGASLISNQWIMTAAHCLRSSSVVINHAYITAHAGSFYKESVDVGEQVFRLDVNNVYVHPSYDTSLYEHDIAVARLERPVTETDQVGPVCLPDTDTTPTPGTHAYVTGFGETQDTGFSDRLKQALVPVMDTDSCHLMYPGTISSNMFCAGYLSGGHDTCQGDSGGPLVIQARPGVWTQYGVTSFGAGCAESFSTGVYTNVVNYLPWVQQYVNTS